MKTASSQEVRRSATLILSMAGHKSAVGFRGRLDGPLGLEGIYTLRRFKWWPLQIPELAGKAKQGQQ